VTDIIETKSDPRALRIYLNEGTTIYFVRLQALANDCELLIEILRRNSVPPRVSSPRLPTEHSFHLGSVGSTTISLQLAPIEALIAHLDWTHQVQIYHGIARAFFELGMPSEVYVAFHEFLGTATCFPIAECIEAWVPGTGPGYDAALGKSLDDSLKHVTLGPGCVFRKTSLVLDRLKEISVERERTLEAEKSLADATLNGLLLPSNDRESVALLLGPGEVRYILPKALAARDCEEIIQRIRERTPHPKVECPDATIYGHSGSSTIFPDFQRVLDFQDLGAGFEKLSWDDQIRQIHSVSKAFYEFGVPSRVMRVFNEFFGARMCSVADCIQAWVPETYGDRRVSRSYLDSEGHLVLDSDCVFVKTERIQQRIEEKKRIEAQQQMAEEEKGKRDDEQKRIDESRDIEALQKSAFDTFVYLMQDTRNHACKIGHSKTPGKRERTLQSEQPTTALRFAIPADQSREKQLHAMFATKRTRGEWFDLSAEEIISTIDFLKKHGDCTRAIADFDWIGRVYVQISILGSDLDLGSDLSFR
jgi:hypothetical protein